MIYVRAVLSKRFSNLNCRTDELYVIPYFTQPFFAIPLWQYCTGCPGNGRILCARIDICHSTLKRFPLEKLPRRKRVLDSFRKEAIFALRINCIVTRRNHGEITHYHYAFCGTTTRARPCPSAIERGNILIPSRCFLPFTRCVNSPLSTLS